MNVQIRKLTDNGCTSGDDARCSNACAEQLVALLIDSSCRYSPLLPSWWLLLQQLLLLLLL